MLYPIREALKLISCGAVIIYAGIYTIRVGMYGNYLQKFQLWGWKRRYTRNPSAADRRLYTVAGWGCVLVGIIACAAGTWMLVKQ
jgi:hypothetical protein